MADVVERLKAALADRYRIERELGAGGMATVYLAEDLRHHRKVAVKVLRPDLAASLGLERFLREVTIAANLTHPHILPLHDSGEVDGFLYYVMPYVEGTSLRQKLLREGELPIPEAVRILRDVADGMAYAHRHGVVHRDIKPENVMLADRHALIMDFGVAKAVSEATGRQTFTTAGVALGTPTYMAPEQAAADPHTDHRADVYAFGVVAYELLTGRPPFVGGSPQAVLGAHVTLPPEPVTKFRASIPPGLATLVMKCLEKKPADRWQSADELIPQLEAALTPSGGVTPTNTQPVAAVHRRLPRWPLLMAGAGVLAVLSVFAWRFTRHATAPPVGTIDAEHSVAVLVFALLTQDSSQAYLAQGLSEDVSTALSGVPGFRVKAPSAVRRVQQTAMADLKALGKTLGVAYLVDGSIRPVGDKLRVSVRLVTPEKEESKWAASYDRGAAAMLDLPSEIARGVATTLAGAESAAAAGSLARRATASPEAYDAYLKGNFYFAQRSAPALNLAVANYRRALELDSTFAAARARIAMCYGQMAEYGWLPAGTTQAMLVAQGSAEADTALRQDSTTADAWVAVGYFHYLQPHVDSRREVEAYRQAIRLDSNHIEANQRLAWAMLFAGDYAAAADRMRSVITLDPGFVNPYRALARIAALQGHFVEARALLDTAVALAPQSTMALAERARLNLLVGDLTGAERDAAAASTLGAPGMADWIRPLLQAAKGNPAVARRDAIEADRPLYHRAAMLYAIGDRAAALKMLEQSELTVSQLTSTTMWGPLQSEPRFQAVLKAARVREGTIDTVR